MFNNSICSFKVHANHKNIISKCTRLPSYKTDILANDYYYEDVDGYDDKFHNITIQSGDDSNLCVFKLIFFLLRFVKQNVL